MRLEIFFKFFAVLLIFCLMVGVLASCSLVPKRRYTDYSFDYFDTFTSVIGFEINQNDFDETSERIMSMLDKYHKLFDIYHSYDGINNLYTLNQERGSAENPIKVDREIIELLEFSKDCYDKTDGYVNIAMGSVLALWHQQRKIAEKKPADAKVPTEAELSSASAHTDISNLVINKADSTVYLADSGMSLDVGAIAKGYAVERIAQALEAEGVSGYVLNVGGNVRTIGRMSDGSPWQVQIENPNSSDIDNPYIESLYLSGEALVTSGSTKRSYTVNGIDYHHIIDKDTNYPAEGYLSVSVVSKDSGIGDALSTALFCVDLEQGMEILSHFEDAAAMWVLADGSIRYSEGFTEYRTLKS